MSTIKLDVVAPEQVVLSRDVNFVVIPTGAGEIGVLPRHTELASTVKAGVVKVRVPEGEGYLFVSDGFVQVKPDLITLLVDSAELPEMIDINRAEKAKERAEMRLKEHNDQMDVMRAEAALRRAIYRIEVVELSKTAGNILEREHQKQ